MEIFVDFGLFELLAALGLTSLATYLYSRKWVGIIVLLMNMVLSLGLLIFVQGEALKWLAAANFALTLVNATVVFEAMKKKWLPRAGQSKEDGEGTG